MGVLSALPVVAAGNVCCCLWVVSGGVVAAYVLQQNQSAPITPGDGALVGLLAGIIGAGVYLVVSIPVSLMVAPFERAMLGRIAEMSGSMPPEFRSFLGNGFAAGGFRFLRMIFGFMFMLVAGAIFSTLGGLLGALVFKKSAPPPLVDPAAGS